MIRPPALAAAALLAAGVLVPAVAPLAAPAATATTAWQNGSHPVDAPNVVRRSEIVLGAPNSQAAQSLPLGNGSPGIAAWAGGGMTLRAWVSATKDELVVDVTGADPNTAQSATVSLWSGRGPQAAASDAGAGAPVANRTAIGRWEEFDLITN